MKLFTKILSSFLLIQTAISSGVTSYSFFIGCHVPKFIGLKGAYTNNTIEAKIEVILYDTAGNPISDYAPYSENLVALDDIRCGNDGNDVELFKASWDEYHLFPELGNPIPAPAVGSVSIEISGSDAFLIERAWLTMDISYLVDAMHPTVLSWGDDNSGGWCLSNDPYDFKHKWSAYQRCFSRLNFDADENVYGALKLTAASNRTPTPAPTLTSTESNSAECPPQAPLIVTPCDMEGLECSYQLADAGYQLPPDYSLWCRCGGFGSFQCNVI